MKQKMTKIICLLLTAVFIIGLAGCGGDITQESTNPSTQDVMNTTEVTTEDITDATEDTTEVTTEPTEAVTEKQQTLQEFLDGAAFIGDSVTLKLRNYDTEKKIMGNVIFLCQGSYSVAHAVNNTMYLSYQGEDITPQDALKKCGANKVFILLGMNDIALHGLDKTMDNWGTLIDNIRQENPQIEIYIQSGTPIYYGGEVGSLTNENMDKYNVRLQSFAAENNCTYVDIATRMKDTNNGLAKAYCSDEFVHMTDAGCSLWLDILKELTEK